MHVGRFGINAETVVLYVRDTKQQGYVSVYACTLDGGPGVSLTLCCFVLCLTLCYFFLVFFSPFSIASTSLGEERASLSAFRTFVRFALVWFCLFPLPLSVWEGLRFVIVALPGLFTYLVFGINLDTLEHRVRGTKQQRYMLFCARKLACLV